MNSELTEILIGKFLDSEITPAEQRILDAELKRNPEAQKLLDSLSLLCDQGREVLEKELDTGASAADIFGLAWQQSKPKRRAVNSLSYYGRWAAAIVIGFLLGTIYHQQQVELGRHFTQPGVGITKTIGQASKQAAAAGFIPAMTGQNSVEPAPSSDGPKNGTSAISPSVEWYTYSDGNGNQWLIENENAAASSMITPVVYHGAL